MDTETMTEIDRGLLQHLPLGMALLNDEQRIGWVNATLCRLLGCEAKTLIGQKIDELPRATQRMLATEPRIYAADGDLNWLSRESYSDDLGQQLLVISDISSQEQLAAENARLRQQVEDLKLTDDLTGLPNKRAISQALDLHISRSRRYQNPLSVVLVFADLIEPDGVQLMSNEPLLLAIARFLRDRLRWVDQIGRWDDKVFLLVLPETDAEDARGLLDKIAAEQHTLLLPDAPESRPQLSFGLACWQKGDDMRTLLRSALQELQRSMTH
jgi:diguanylate cyclase (GGDEF)-like protein